MILGFILKKNKGCFRCKISKQTKLQKTAEKWLFLANFDRFLKFIQFWPKNSAPNPKNWISWRISLLWVPILPPKLAMIVEQLLVLCFVLRFCDESALWWSFLFFSKWSLMSCGIAHVSLEDSKYHIWPKYTGIIMCCIHFQHKFGWNQIHFS